MSDPSTTVLLLLALAALVAGFVDAVVGGGGLVQLPALLVLVPGLAPVQVLATNKVAAICGTTVSAATYVRRVRPDSRTFVPLMICAFAGSAAGAAVASQVPKGVFQPVVLAALVLVGAWVLLRPTLGEETELRWPDSRRHTLGAVAIGLLVGFYDGALGPGTGSFLVVGLVGLLGYSFLEASAKARLANVATNLAALVVFVPQGAVVWHVALVMGAANLLGGYVGARTAVRRGTGFVRALFVVVVSAFAIRIAGDLAGLW